MNHPRGEAIEPDGGKRRPGHAPREPGELHRAGAPELDLDRRAWRTEKIDLMPLTLPKGQLLAGARLPSWKRAGSRPDRLELGEQPVLVDSTCAECGVDLISVHRACLTFVPLAK